MTEKNQLIAKMKTFRSWYHKIDLGQGIITPGQNFDGVWENIRKSRNCIVYKRLKMY